MMTKLKKLRSKSTYSISWLKQYRVEELDKMIDEYNNIGYSDVIKKGLFARFKYKNVKAADFGLKPEEILLLNDKELAQLVKLKQYKPYRDDEDEFNVHKVKQIKKERKPRIKEEKSHIKQVMKANVSSSFLTFFNL